MTRTIGTSAAKGPADIIDFVQWTRRDVKESQSTHIEETCLIGQVRRAL